MSKCETCKWKNAEDGWAVCDGCIHAPDLEDKYKPLSNADHIHAMSDEELAKIIMCPYDNDRNSCVPGSNCLDCCLKWLRQPYEEETP